MKMPPEKKMRNGKRTVSMGFGEGWVELSSDRDSLSSLIENAKNLRDDTLQSFVRGVKEKPRDSG